MGLGVGGPGRFFTLADSSYARVGGLLSVVSSSRCAMVSSTGVVSWPARGAGGLC